MFISRRKLLGRLAAGVAASTALHTLSGFSFADTASAPYGNSRDTALLLCSNENAYGPSEKVLAAMSAACSGANHYSHTEFDSLRKQIADIHQAKPEQVILGCGSSEILQMTAATFLGPGKKLVQAAPTCLLPGEFAQSSGAEIINVPLNKMYEHDLRAMLARFDASTSLVYICNPNSPTGTLTPRKDIERFIASLPATTVVLIDEAYHHFVSKNSAYASFLDQPVNDHRVIVTRTFSKIYGLAGMRVGYAIASQEIAQRLSKNSQQLGMSVVSARAAAAALDDSEYILLAAKRNADDRQEFMNQVNARMLRALDSHTNFVMLNPLRSVDEVLTHLKKHNIVVGPRIPEMDKYIRVSLGTPAQMLEFWRVWDLMPHNKMAM